MIITYEIEKTITARTVSLKTLTETTNKEVIKYIDANRETVFKAFNDLADLYSNWETDEYDTDFNFPSFVAHKDTNTQSIRVEILMRNAMYYEND